MQKDAISTPEKTSYLQKIIHNLYFFVLVFVET